MTDMTFVHLTDLHVLPNDEDELYGRRTTDKLRDIMKLIRNMDVSPDFFILSGDLVNDGQKAEYRRLNTVLDELREFGAPLILGLGNHDGRVNFRQIVLGEETTDESERYYHSTMLGGLRVIMLDSKLPDAVYGDLDEPQLAWLAEELQEPAPLGNLIAIHHPPVFSTVEPLSEHCLKNPEGLAKAIAGHHVHAHADQRGDVEAAGHPADERVPALGAGLQPEVGAGGRGRPAGAAHGMAGGG